MNLDVSVCLPQEVETVGLLRSVVAHALESFGVTPECTDDIRLALSEACTNVIEYAAPDDEYELHLQIDGHRCAISVRNTGAGIDSAVLAGTMPDASSPDGRGVAIMHAVMDQVDFRSEPERGTIVHLVKQLTLQQGSLLERLRQSD